MMLRIMKCTQVCIKEDFCFGKNQFQLKISFRLWTKGYLNASKMYFMTT